MPLREHDSNTGLLDAPRHRYDIKETKIFLRSDMGAGDGTVPWGYDTTLFMSKIRTNVLEILNDDFWVTQENGSTLIRKGTWNIRQRIACPTRNN